MIRGAAACPYCEALCEWRKKPRIRHIRNKFKYQYNFHQAEDDKLDENQVLLHEIGFGPHHPPIESSDITRVKLQAALAGIHGDRSQLERVVKRELQFTYDSKKFKSNKTKGKTKTLDAQVRKQRKDIQTRIAVLNLLLTPGASRDEVDQNIDKNYENYMADFVHTNLFRAMFLEFNEAISEYLSGETTVDLSHIRANTVKVTGNQRQSQISSTEMRGKDRTQAQTTGAQKNGQGALDKDTELIGDIADEDGNVADLAEAAKISEFCLELQNVGFDFSSDSDMSEDQP